MRLLTDLVADNKSKIEQLSPVVNEISQSGLKNKVELEKQRKVLVDRLSHLENIVMKLEKEFVEYDNKTIEYG